MPSEDLPLHYTCTCDGDKDPLKEKRCFDVKINFREITFD